MVTVHREGGFRVTIYRNDHEPPHVHVIKDGEIIIYLGEGPDAPTVREAQGFTSADQRKAMRIVASQLEMLRAKWKEMHGGTD